jgi:predicted acetyltransferase
VNINIRLAPAEEQDVVANLLQCYLHDFSEFTPVPMDARGRFSYPYLAHYWHDPQRYPFLVEHKDQIVGLALLRLDTDPATGNQHMDMAEFFILRAHRRCGLGRTAACALFSLFPGPWQVRVMRANQAAYPFWQACIGDHTGGHYVETTEPRTRVFNFDQADH